MSFSNIYAVPARLAQVISFPVLTLLFALGFSFTVTAQETVSEAAVTSNSSVDENKKLANEYQLVPGDKIKVHVLGQEDLSIEAQITDTNTIIFPLVGELSVANHTREQTEQLIHGALQGDYLVNPEVSVTVISYRQIYIQGEVKEPGPYPYVPGLSLRRAILNAGGFTEVASKGKIYVVNEFQTDEKQKKVDLAYKMVPGDIITVRASFF